MRLSLDRSGTIRTKTAWGARLEVVANDTIGHSIMQFGVYDLTVSEALSRLVDRGDLCVDGGANIGYTALLMATRVGDGRVLAFEPHPQLWQSMEQNIALNSELGAHIELHQSALGPEAGPGLLKVPEAFHDNCGTSSMATDAVGQGIGVDVVRLDDLLGSQTVGLFKLDVEGFEPDVVRGSLESFKRRRVRDFVYEHNETDADRVGDMIRPCGYSQFKISKRWHRPALTSITSAHGSTWEPENRLLTLDPKRAQQRFRKFGWMSLKPLA